jgi:hypothetical protein
MNVIKKIILVRWRIKSINNIATHKILFLNNKQFLKKKTINTS